MGKPDRNQLAWQELERTMFVHLSPAAWQGTEVDERTTPLSEMKLEKLDTDQWCEAARSWGAGMIVFVAKHGGGFCWWQTDTTPYSVKNIAWKDGKGDLLGEVSESCKKYGLKLGIYIYPGDPQWGAMTGGKTREPEKQEAYNRIYRQQLTEVLTRYGTISEVWFDGSCGIDVSDILREYAPEAVIFQGPDASIRWCGTEKGEAPPDAWASVSREALKLGTATAAQSRFDGDAYAPLEVDTPLYDHYWFWSKEKEKKRKTLGDLIRTYYFSVGRGAQLLLNASPTSDGNICEEDLRLYRAFGEELRRRFESPLAQADYPSLERQGGELVCSVALPGKSKWNHLVLMEDIREGEQVCGYTVETLEAGGWKELRRGQRIGHKRILVFPEQEAEAVRIRLNGEKGAPVLRSAAVYFCPPVQGDEELIKEEKVSCYDAEKDEWVLM